MSIEAAVTGTLDFKIPGEARWESILRADDKKIRKRESYLNWTARIIWMSEMGMKRRQILAVTMKMHDMLNQSRGYGYCWVAEASRQSLQLALKDNGIKLEEKQ